MLYTSCGSSPETFDGSVFTSLAGTRTDTHNRYSLHYDTNDYRHYKSVCLSGLGWAALGVTMCAVNATRVERATTPFASWSTYQSLIAKPIIAHAPSINPSTHPFLHPSILPASHSSGQQQWKFISHFMRISIDDLTAAPPLISLFLLLAGYLAAWLRVGPLNLYLHLELNRADLYCALQQHSPVMFIQRGWCKK